MNTTHERPQPLKFRTGDTVKVIAGADRGKKGKIQQVFLRAQLAVVDGVNLRSKSVRSKQQGQKGEMIQYFSPIAISNLILVCPNCSESTRVGIVRTEKKRQRTCKKCKQVIDK